MERQIENMQWQELPADQFAALGVGALAYVKPALHEGKPVFEIHGADGSQMGLAPGREIAFAAVKQHDLEPVSVH